MSYENSGVGNQSRECKLCGMPVTVKTWQKHLRSRIHAERKFVLQRHVLVSGYPPDTREEVLIEYFFQFGPLESVQFDARSKRFMIVKFHRISVADLVVNHSHSIGRYPLTVVPRNPMLLQTGLDSKELDWKEYFLNYLLTQDTLNEQIFEIVHELSLTPEDIHQRSIFCDRLEERFRDFFPSCTLMPFGPTVNTLGTKGCDLDLFLNLNLEPEAEKLNIDLEQLRNNLDLVQRAPDKSTFLKLIQRLETVEVIEIIGAIIRRYVPGVEDVFAQASARCPTVRFRLKLYSFTCDISVNSEIAVYNTILISNYQKIDDRFRMLYFTIHYWCKHHHLGNSRKGRLSKYAITILVIFFLQNSTPKVLPTVESLQQSTTEKLFCNGWECQLPQDDINFKGELDPEKDVGTLLAEFFTFYANLDFDNYMLCFRNGEVKLKAAFVEEMQQSENSVKFTKLKIRPLTVQDPFELNRNITANVTDDVFLEWISVLKEASKCVSRLEFQKKAQDLWGIPLLLCGMWNEQLTDMEARSRAGSLPSA